MLIQCSEKVDCIDKIKNKTNRQLQRKSPVMTTDRFRNTNVPTGYRVVRAECKDRLTLKCVVRQGSQRAGAPLGIQSICFLNTPYNQSTVSHAAPPLSNSLPSIHRVLKQYQLWQLTKIFLPQEGAILDDHLDSI